MANLSTVNNDFFVTNNKNYSLLTKISKIGKLGVYSLTFLVAYLGVGTPLCLIACSINLLAMPYLWINYAINHKKWDIHRKDVTFYKFLYLVPGTYGFFYAMNLIDKFIDRLDRFLNLDKVIDDAITVFEKN